MNIHETGLENALVWSAHRTRLIGQCPRKYFYNFIRSWEGWDTTQSPETQAAYRFKNLTSPELEAGTVVHNVIRGIFTRARLGLSIRPSDEIKYAQSLFENFIDQSQRRRLEDCTAKRRKLLLHQLGGGLDSEAVSTYLERIATHIEAFFQLADVKVLLATPSAVLWDFLDPSGFEVGAELEVPARLKTDLVFLEANTYVIGDWKCGKALEDHEQQGMVYDLYLRSKLALPPQARVEVRFYYLGFGKAVTFTFDDDQRAEKLWAIGEQFATLQSYSDDRFLNQGPESRFPARPSFSCRSCNHQLMCREFLSSKFTRQAKKEEA
jgi:hypothetical protein